MLLSAKLRTVDANAGLDQHQLLVVGLKPEHKLIHTQRDAACRCYLRELEQEGLLVDVVNVLQAKADQAGGTR